MAYQAMVARIYTRELPGSDNIQIGTCAGYQVIVSKDVTDGELGVFFEQDGQLSPEFCKANNLIALHDENGNKVEGSGYFEENRRVKAVKMRGAKSEGFWCPMRMFAYTGFDMSKLKEGDTFDSLGTHPICNKYVTEATLKEQKARDKKPVKTRTADKMFTKLGDTTPFRMGVNLIPKGAIVYLSEKLHGTSFRYGHVLDDVVVKLPVWKQWIHRLLKKPAPTKPEWVHLNGSRNVVLEKRTGEGFYGGGEQFRYRATERINLKKGEVIYGELVGYTDTGRPIMEPQDASRLRDKKVEKAFGKTIVYKYNTEVGQCDLYVYRIKQVNEDGYVVELSWPQVVARCRELGLRTVPVSETFIFDGDFEALSEKVMALTNGPDGQSVLASGVDPSHIQEGIVVRYESEHGFGWLKSKAFAFGLLEGYLKEQADYVDTEEIA